MTENSAQQHGKYRIRHYMTNQCYPIYICLSPCDQIIEVPFSNYLLYEGKRIYVENEI